MIFSDFAHVMVCSGFLSKPPRGAPGLLGGGKDNSPEKVEVRARVLQLHECFPLMVYAEIGRIVSGRTGRTVTRNLVRTIIRNGVATVPERGGARQRFAADFKARFVASIVGHVDHNGYRRGGTSLRAAVRRWNNDDDEKVDVTRTSAARWLKEAGFKPYVPSVGPAITAENERQRQAWYDKHHRHSENWWLALVFSDSHTVHYRHTPNPRNERVWARPGEKVPAGKRRRRDRQNLNVYGAMCKWGMVGPFFYEGNINGRGYIRRILGPMLRAIAKIFADNNDRLRWTFQQDGAGAHIFKDTQAYLARSGFRFWSKREWPGNSADISPIENIWPDLQHFCTPPGDENPSEDELKSRVLAWFALDHTVFCRKALRGMRGRCVELHEASWKYIGR